MRRSNALGLAILGFAVLAGAALVLDVGGVQQKLLVDPSRTKAGPTRLAEPQPAPAPTPAAPDAAPREVTPAWFVDASGYDGAELERQATRAPMVVYFQSRGCDRCRKFERDVLAAPPAKAFLSGAVKVRVDVRASDREKTLARRLGIDALPAVYVVPPRGPAHQVPLRRGNGFVSAPELVAFLR